MTRLTQTARWLAAILIALTTVATISTGAGAAANGVLDARLGGTSASFESSFGAPDASQSGNGVEVYKVSGFGLVAAAFLNSNASQITIAADRLAHTPLTDPDAADWTVTDAAKFADALVPTDSSYGDPVSTSSTISIVGHSKALESIFSAKNLTALKVGGKPGDFTVVYNLDTAGNVYSVDISVGTGASAAKPTATPKPASASKKTPTATTSAVLDARLGGSDASFTASFGAPDASQSGNGVEVYKVSGFGLVAAAFLDANASQITIAADRLAHTPLTDPDAADWTTTDAAKFADALVPTDATYGNPVSTSTTITIVGHSKALASVFTAKDLTTLKVGGKAGDFTVVYNLDTSGNVYSVDISVGSGASSAKPTATPKSTSASKKTPTAAANSSSSAAVHCKDFKTQAEAQAYFDSHGGDTGATVSTLDGDHDGKACEDLP